MFYILETRKQSPNGNGLIELHEVLNEIGHLEVDYWLLQDTDHYGGFPADAFNKHCAVFQKQTSTEPKGFYMSQNDFQIYNNPDLRLIDGIFIAINSSAEEEPLLVLEIFDSGTWYAATTNELIGERLIKCGWEKSLCFPPNLRGFSDWVNKFKADTEAIGSGVVFDLI